MTDYGINVWDLTTHTLLSTHRIQWHEDDLFDYDDGVIETVAIQCGITPGANTWVELTD